MLRRYLGLDVRAGELRAVALRRKGKRVVLLGGRCLALASEVLSFSVRDPNIRDPRCFTETLRAALVPLAGGEDRISLSLPEGTGRVLLTEMETELKNHDQGVEVLKWQLKNSLPAEPKEVHLDYQILERRENGRHRMVVALMTKDILRQYEEVLWAAGFNPAVINFHSLNLYNYYRSRIDLGEDFALVRIEGRTLSYQFFQKRLLAYHRTREVEATVAGVYQELNRSLSGCREQYASFARATVFLHSDWPERDELIEPLQALFEREVVPLEPHLQRLGALPAGLTPWQSRSLATAIGAAGRLMGGQG